MLNDTYEIVVTDDFKTFQFESNGPKGRIIKVVKYTMTKIEGLFNLGFGDMQEDVHHIDDLALTNNKDTEKVLTTVGSTLYAFTGEYPNATVYAEGSTRSRTRLYQMGIAKNLEAIERDFEILGFNGKEWERFQRNISYEAFLAYRKL